MRSIIYSSMALALVATPCAGFAQETATRSPNDFVCALTGKCGAETETAETKEAPETKGFRVYRPAPDAAARIQPVRTTAPRTPSAVAAGQVRKPQSKVALNVPETAKSAAAARVDLRLSFEKGSNTLTAHAREEARAFAQALQMPQLSSKRFVIEGHTDKLGSRAFNLDLSRQRAQAVADYLVSLGVSPERLEVRGYGFDRPLEGQSAAAKENRRVEAVLVS